MYHCLILLLLLLRRVACICLPCLLFSCYLELFHSHAAVSVPFRSTPPFFGSFSSPYLRLGTLPIWIFVSLNSIEALSRRRRWRGANALLQTAQPEKRANESFSSKNTGEKAGGPRREWQYDVCGCAKKAPVERRERGQKRTLSNYGVAYIQTNRRRGKQRLSCSFRMCV